MKYTHTHLTRIVAIAVCAAASFGPLTVIAAENAPTTPRPAAVRQLNLDRNRDIRNETMKQRVLAPVAAPMPSRISEARRVPLWLTSTSTSPWSKNMSTSTLKSLRQSAHKYASTTPPGGHENWKKARLDIFLWMQSRLLAETQESLNNLTDLRFRIADKIQLSSEQGYDMSRAVRLLSVADERLIAADDAIADIAAISPTFAATSTITHIEPSTEVRLDGPRETGKIAIKAISEARKALHEVVIAIAREIGPANNNATSTER